MLDPIPEGLVTTIQHQDINHRSNTVQALVFIVKDDASARLQHFPLLTNTA